MEVWAEFKLKKELGKESNLLLMQVTAKTVKENRHCIRAVIDALLYTTCQNIALRGHREGSNSDN